jgi:hypothetical protein
MARTKHPRFLPVLPPLSTLSRSEKKGEGLLQILRRLAKSSRNRESKLFYSLRDVAAHYRLPLSRVARHYRQLESEGLISRIRGSRTILRGSGPTRQLFVPNVVAMPASLSCFIGLQDYRMFLIQARRKLRQRNFITVIAFYEDRSDAEELAERIQQARADVVLWYLPDTAARISAPRLRDLGIRLIGVSDGGLPSVPCHYEIHRTAAIRAILHDWQASGIRRVLIPRGESRSSADEERLETVLLETSLQWRFVGVNFALSAHRTGKLAAEKDEAVILLAAAATLFLMRAPEAFDSLARICRVALPDGPVSLPLTPRLESPVDLAVVDWEGVAERVADDITSGRAFSAEDKPIVIQATAKLKAPLHKFAQRI